MHLQEMQDASLPGTVYTLTNLVNACVRCGELAQAEAFIKEFAEKGKIKPPVSIFITHCAYSRQAYWPMR